MRRWSRTVLAAGVLVGLGTPLATRPGLQDCGTVAAATLAPAAAQSALAAGAPSAGNLRIEWGKTWEATYAATRERWRAELTALDAEPLRRNHEFAQRLIRLAHALVERYPQGSERPEFDYRRLGDDLGTASLDSRTAAYLRQFVAEFPGQTALVAAVLDMAIERVKFDAVRDDGGVREMADFASSRGIALYEAGCLPPGHPLAARAYAARAIVLLFQGRYWDAARALDQLEAVAGRTVAWREIQMEVVLASGRLDDAVPLLAELASLPDHAWWDGRLKALQALQDPPPDFPRDLGVEMKWGAIHTRTSGSDTASVQSLLDESAAGQGLMPDETGRRASTWVLLDRLLAAQKPEVLTPLRQSQQAAAEEALDRARRSGDTQALIAAGRRYPWATATHQAMAASGQEMLRRGWSGLALRMFQDVLARTTDAETRAKAQAGLWLALAGETQESEVIKRAFEGVAPDATFPWLGGERRPASAIRDQLLEAVQRNAGRPAAVPAADISAAAVRLPPVAPWAPGELRRLPEDLLRAMPWPLAALQATDQGVLVSGPRLLAWYDNDLSKPLWWRTGSDNGRSKARPGRGGSPENAVAVPGTFRPVIAGGRLYSRWGIDPASPCPRGVAALNARTGEIEWSTDGDPAWDQRWPISDPVLSDGRLYILTVQSKLEAILPVYLACLDAERGAILWDRPLGSQNPTLGPGEGYYRREPAVESVRYGSAVTVDRGAVYCATNLGFVARCDARDGMVEWVAVYPRVRAGANLGAILRRQGSAPVVSGDRVIVAPRDCQGIFALEGQTGNRVWESPLVPAEEVVGLAGGTLVVRGDGHLVALDAASGRVIWDRPVKERMTAPPALAAGGILVPLSGRLLHVDAATGAVVAEKPLGPGEAPAGGVVRGNSLVGVSQTAAMVDRAAPAAPDAAGAALPLKASWRLVRPAPHLFVPPAEAKVPGKLYLASRGVLECLTPGGVAWQRFLPPGAEEPLWAERTLIMSSERRLMALDAETGQARWECELPFHVGVRRVCGPYVAVIRQAGEPPQEQMMALVELASGRLVWVRPIRSAKRITRLVDVGWDGKDLHAYGDTRDPGEAMGVEFVVRADSGDPVAVRPFPAAEDPRPRAVLLGDGFGFCLTAGKAVWGFSMADGKAVRHAVDLRDLELVGGMSARLSGPWLQIQQAGGVAPGGRVTDADGNPPTGRQWVLRRGDPAYRLYLDYLGDITGDTLYVPGGRSLRAIDLATKKEVGYRIPGAADLGSLKSIIDFGRTKDRVWIACGLGPPRDGGPLSLRMETFDPTAGTWLGGQAVAGIFPEGGWLRRNETLGDRGEGLRGFATECLWTDQRIYITDPRGLTVLAAAAPNENLDTLRQPVPVASRPVTVDGSLQEWDDRGAVAVTGPGRRTGRLYLAHDEARLYLALRYPCPSFMPRIGEEDAGGGDWIEMSLTTARESLRLSLSADARGRVRWESLSDEPLPKGLLGAIRHDAAARELVYETAFPLKETFAQSGTIRHLGVSISVWDEQPGGGGPARVLTWGEGLAGRRALPEADRQVYLDALPLKAAETLAAVVDELPDLPESFEYFMRDAALRAESPEARLGLYADFMKRHPKETTVERLLTFERTLRPRYVGDVTRRLLEAAAAAGVPQAVCRRYDLESRAYLSQWVYVDSPKEYPSSILLEVNDGTAPGSAGLEHRVFWIRPYWEPWERPTAYAMPMFDRFPPQAWYEIRAPLSLLSMNGTPVCGLLFSQRGGPRLAWGRTAVGFGGKEETVLDGALPEGAQASGAWEWLDKPSRGGRKSHTHAPVENAFLTQQHGCDRFAKPAMGHVSAPADGGYVSQWIYIDPKEPPRSVSVGLHDGKAWRCHAVWGAPSACGRYMGALPPAGSWQELRVPLAWTGLAADPIAGFSFGQDGGRVYWDRTALVAGGKDTVVVDDNVPPPADPPPVAWQPWFDAWRGAPSGTRPCEGKVGVGLACDGYSGYLEAPPSPALDPDELTVEAWIYQHWPPEGKDRRKWLVAKNGNEETDGHYALVLNDLAVGAYLNIGGGKANSCAAMADKDVLTLDKWQHVAMTYDGRDLKVYLNGKVAAETPIGKKRTKGAGRLNVGRRPDGYSYSSVYIDEIRVFNRALGPEVLAARFAAGGRPPPEDQAKSVVAWWGFDDDVTPETPGAGWQWVQQPAKSGQLAHTQLVSDHWAGHSWFLRQPVLDHLAFDRKRAGAVLRRRVPDLGPSDEAWRLFWRMVQIEAEPAARIDLAKWFVKAIPEHPHVIDAVDMMADEYLAQHRGEKYDVDARIRELGLAPSTFYAYNRKYPFGSRNYLTKWQLLGPFPNPDGQGHSTVYPPETEGVKLSAEYDGVGGKVRWQAHESGGAMVNLTAVFGPRPAPGEPPIPPTDPRNQLMAYAACWIHSDTAQKAIFEVGRGDSCKVWLNRKLLFEAAGQSDPAPGQDLVPVDLPAGWSELLMKVGNLHAGWGFYFEVVDTEGRGIPKGVTFSTPPADLMPRPAP